MGLLENYTAEILNILGVIDFDLPPPPPPPPGMDPGVRCHGMKANPTGYLWSKYEGFLMSVCEDMDF